MQGPRSARRRRSHMGIGQIAPTGASAVPPAEAESPRIDERAAGEHGPPSERRANVSRINHRRAQGSGLMAPTPIRRYPPRTRSFGRGSSTPTGTDTGHGRLGAGLRPWLVDRDVLGVSRPRSAHRVGPDLPSWGCRHTRHGTRGDHPGPGTSASRFQQYLWVIQTFHEAAERARCDIDACNGRT
jgi:hypothetical protein